MGILYDIKQNYLQFEHNFVAFYSYLANKYCNGNIRDNLFTTEIKLEINIDFMVFSL